MRNAEMNFPFHPLGPHGHSTFIFSGVGVSTSKVLLVEIVTLYALGDVRI